MYEVQYGDITYSLLSFCTPYAGRPGGSQLKLPSKPSDTNAALEFESRIVVVSRSGIYLTPRGERLIRLVNFLG